MTTRKLYLAYVLARSASRVGDRLGWDNVPPRSILLGWVEGELSRRGIGLETAPLPAVQTNSWYLPAGVPAKNRGETVTVYRKKPGATVPTNRSILPTEYAEAITVKVFDTEPPYLIYSKPIKDQMITKAIVSRFAGVLVSQAIRPRWAHTRSAPAPLLLPQTDASDWPPPLPPGVDRYNNDRLNAAWKALEKHPEVLALKKKYFDLSADIAGNSEGSTQSSWNQRYFSLCRQLKDNPSRAEAQRWLTEVLLPELQLDLFRKSVEVTALSSTQAPPPPSTAMGEAEQTLALLKSTLGAVVPYVSATIGTLGGKDRPSIMLKVSLTPKQNWPNGIFQNSEHGLFSLDWPGRSIEYVSGDLLKNRPKFRKCKFKNPQDAVNRLVTYLRGE